MQDAIALGTGNSRYLKSVSGFLSLYPTYEAFAEALVAGTLPIDLNGINPDGWAQQGTALDKANLLTDATAALVDLGSEATVNDVLATLAGLASFAAEKTKKLITCGTSEITNNSPLETGTVYLQYE